MVRKQVNNNGNPSAGHAKVFMMLIEGDSATVQRAVEAAERTISRSGYALRSATPTPPAVMLPTQGPGRDDDTVGAAQSEDEAGVEVQHEPQSEPKPEAKR